MWNWLRRGHRLEKKLDALGHDINLLLGRLKHMSQALEDLKTAVTAESTVVDSAITLIQGLSDQIAALKPDEAAIAQLAADVKAKADALAAAVAAGAPPAPPAQ